MRPRAAFNVHPRVIRFQGSVTVNAKSVTTEASVRYRVIVSVRIGSATKSLAPVRWDARKITMGPTVISHAALVMTRVVMIALEHVWGVAMWDIMVPSVHHDVRVVVKAVVRRLPDFV